MADSEEFKRLSQRQLYEFDLNGFVRIRNFLSAEKVDRVNSILDEVDRTSKKVKFRFFSADPIFLDLLSDPRVMAICEDLIGPWFRFDNAMMIQSGDDEFENLHGGPMEEQNSFYYLWHDRKPRCSQIQISYFLKPVKSGDGGLIVVPGSHKQNAPYLGSQVVNDILRGDLNDPLVVNPELEAGDLLVFTEALIHGTRKWSAVARSRRVLYYKYCLASLCWNRYSDIQYVASLARNDIEKRLLAEPYVARNGSDGREWLNVFRTPVNEPEEEEASTSGRA